MWSLGNFEDGYLWQVIPIPGSRLFRDYFASEYGSIARVDFHPWDFESCEAWKRDRKCLPLIKKLHKFRPSLDNQGYLRTRIYGQNYYIHELVALAWHGERPFESAVIRHLDNDKTNNEPDNLRYGTQMENMEDSPRFYFKRRL